jgi:meso-butanediol dehydrogenase/(S,S)-butanediol dehydrogenase/diacetyl reductase
MNRFKGKVALITGVGRITGIGAGIARRFASESADVAISDICADYKEAPGYGMGSWDQLQKIADELSELGVRGVPIRCDVTKSDEVNAMIEQTVAELGRIDILVNNAGGSPGAAPVMMMEEWAWRRTLDINATGTFLCSKAAAQQMLTQGDGGKIVNLSSRTAKTPTVYLAAYIAAKQAIIGLTRTMALELGPFKININAVCPGYIDTELMREGHVKMAEAAGVTVDDIVADKIKNIPLGRGGTPEDVAGVVTFLCSDDAAYMTGQAINISGGWEMH